MTSGAALADAIRVASAVPRSLDDYRGCTDAQLLERTRLAAELRRIADAHAALAAGEIAHRSTPDLGAAGLVHRAGHRTVEEFVKVATGVTGRDAVAAVQVGRLVHDTDGGLAPVGAAVIAGTLSATAAESIRAGLGDASAAVPIEVISQAAQKLCDEAGSLDPDRLHRRAREIRDELDQAGIADREGRSPCAAVPQARAATGWDDAYRLAHRSGVGGDRHRGLRPDHLATTRRAPLRRPGLARAGRASSRR